MNSVLSERPGPADLLKVAEIETTVVPDDGVLVRLRAASINPVDLFSLTPVRHLMRQVAAHARDHRSLGARRLGVV
jgi:NADPH:quinone reductase-like Zn-dependent oxidoreductase